MADHFGPDCDRAVGSFTSVFPIGGLIGPVLGGIFVTYWTWRGIFLINLPFGITLIILGSIYIKSRDRPVGGHIDVPGVLLLGSGLLIGMFGIAFVGNGVSAASVAMLLACVLMAGSILRLFWLHIGRIGRPFVSPTLLRGRGFGVMNLLNLVYGAAALGFGALIPLYAQDRYGIHILAAGTLLTARAVGTVSVAAIAVAMLRRTGYRLPILGGFTLLAGSLIITAVPRRTGARPTCGSPGRPC